MTEKYDGIEKIKLDLERIVPLMFRDHGVSAEAYHAAQHALKWIALCESKLNEGNGDTRCRFCRHEFFVSESPIGCPACGYATDNWIGDDDLEEILGRTKKDLVE